MAPGQLMLALGAALGASGVMLGAFGAHGLRERLSEQALETWGTAVTYHLVHALALVAVGILARAEFASTYSDGSPAPALLVSGWSFVAGVVLFSGSLYALALGGPRLLGPVTPLGGVAFIVGWVALLGFALRAPAGS